MGWWIESGVSECCAAVQEWRAQNIEACNSIYIIGRNNRMAIIRDIQHISFPVLRWIYLDWNQIVCIEALCRVYMPRLEEIDLSNYHIISGYNYIVSLRPLRKCHWPHLIKIDLGAFILYSRL